MNDEKIVAYHFDLKRPMWKRDYMDEVVGGLAAWGFNTIVYEMEDKFRFRHHPSVVHPDAWSHEDTASFADVCRTHGVNVVPLVQTLGHAESVVGKQPYAHLRETPEVDSQYDPLSADARALILEFVDEVIDVMRPAGFFHVGGDETWSLGKSAKCRAIVDKIGVGGLYVRHMRPILEHVKSRGLRPMIWADMLLTHPEIIGEIPSYVLMVDWDYATESDRPTRIQVWGKGQLDWEQVRTMKNDAFAKHLFKYAVDDRTPKDGTFRPFYCADALRDMGFETITASANRSFGDMTGIPNALRHTKNCYYSALKGFAGGVGNLVTSWAVRRGHVETTWPSTFAAVCARERRAPSWPTGIHDAFTREFFGSKVASFGEAAFKAEWAFCSGEAHHIEQKRRMLNAGEDPLPSMLEQLVARFGDREKAKKALGIALTGYGEAVKTFEDMKRTVKKRPGSLDYWIEGTLVNAFHARFMSAALDDALAGKKGELLDLSDRLADRTRSLFGRTYTDSGTEDEVDTRYGFHRAYLQEMT